MQDMDQSTPSPLLIAPHRQLAERIAVEFIMAGLIAYIFNLEAERRGISYPDVLCDFAAQTDRHLQNAKFREWPDSTPELVETIRANASGVVARIVSRAQLRSGY